jgi:acetate kinase
VQFFGPPLKRAGLGAPRIVMTKCIAVINAGSSSVKFAIYAATDDLGLFHGQIEGLGVAPRFTIADVKGSLVEDRKFPSDGFDHEAATGEILAMGTTLLQEGRVVAGLFPPTRNC